MDLSHIEFDLSDFESFKEPDNNAVIYTNDQLGIKVRWSNLAGHESLGRMRL
jgi:hypothetical protein